MFIITESVEITLLFTSNLVETPHNAPINVKPAGGGGGAGPGGGI